jgi:deazaflavin-dependent oxidoreductase (nitroreductase family)
MSYQRALPHVDPEAPRGPLHRAAMRLASTRAVVVAEAALPARLTVWRIVPRLMRLTGGRFAWLVPVPVGVIETRDPRNGRPHRRVVIYFHDGERVTVIPSKSGLPEDPFWYRNALADPDVSFESVPFRAEPVEGEADRARLWRIADRFYPPSVAYRRRAAESGRTIPILQLVPRRDEGQRPAASSS